MTIEYEQCNKCHAYVPLVVGTIHVCRDDRGEQRAEVRHVRDEWKILFGAADRRVAVTHETKKAQQ